MADLLTAAEAARRLGVKPATLYAYVSRGVLSRGKAADGRASLFHADEIERLARRGRPRRPPGVADITVESAITEIAGDRLRFRGLDVARLAVSRTFEEVAELLWTGELRSAREAWQARPAAWPRACRAGSAARADAPARAAPGDRPGDGGDRSAPAPARPGRRDRGWPEHHRRHGGLPARDSHPRSGHPRSAGIPGPGGASQVRASRCCRASQVRASQIPASRSLSASGRGCATTGPAPRCCARCPPRWSC